MPSTINTPPGQATTLDAPQALVTKLHTPAPIRTTMAVGQGPSGPPGAPEFVETGPAFTYTAGLLTRIDYDSGNHKTFNYQAGLLHQIVYQRGTDTITKTFVYDGAGNLTRIEQT